MRVFWMKSPPQTGQCLRAKSGLMTFAERSGSCQNWRQHSWTLTFDLGNQFVTFVHLGVSISAFYIIYFLSAFVRIKEKLYGPTDTFGPCASHQSNNREKGRTRRDEFIFI